LGWSLCYLRHLYRVVLLLIVLCTELERPPTRSGTQANNAGSLSVIHYEYYSLLPWIIFAPFSHLSVNRITKNLWIFIKFLMTKKNWGWLGSGAEIIIHRNYYLHFTYTCFCAYITNVLNWRSVGGATSLSHRYTLSEYYVIVMSCRVLPRH